tara:strand:- start:8 stop:424 length:417 start_codon:yes stop_codon:yes gene_type:complete
MNMTPQEKADWLDAAIAMMDGEPIEFRSLLNGQWLPATHIAPGRAHRRKPAPAAACTNGSRLVWMAKLVPLGPDDLLGCVIRLQGDSAGFLAIQEALHLGVQTTVGHFSYNALQYNRWEYHRLGEIEDGKPVWRRCEK